MKEPTHQEICLTAEEVKALDQIIGKLPTSIGMVFVDFFRFIQQQKAEAQTEAVSEEKLEKYEG